MKKLFLILTIGLCLFISPAFVAAYSDDTAVNGFDDVSPQLLGSTRVWTQNQTSPGETGAATVQDIVDKGLASGIGAGTKHDGFFILPATEVQTTDNSQTTLDSITLLDDNTYHAEAWVIGVENDGSQRTSSHIACTVYRVNAGGATLQGSVTSLHTQESEDWDITFTVSGSDLRVSVTGAAATTIEWGGTLSYINMSE